MIDARKEKVCCTTRPFPHLSLNSVLLALHLCNARVLLIERITKPTDLQTYRFFRFKPTDFSTITIGFTATNLTPSCFSPWDESSDFAQFCPPKSKFDLLLNLVSQVRSGQSWYWVSFDLGPHRQHIGTQFICLSPLVQKLWAEDRASSNMLTRGANAGISGELVRSAVRR